ncbi:hypothetical protein B6N60_01424 [Richelia sinica FACHB-800]|uniref:Uncharacterized protein n=2 Tax=Richelia TaxID=98443 RepID=A0A975Y424_9NOST|nr:hypothetical protein B6N60_01424 [Richelia sinica FACHB-800]
MLIDLIRFLNQPMYKKLSLIFFDVNSLNQKYDLLIFVKFCIKIKKKDENSSFLLGVYAKNLA